MTKITNEIVRDAADAMEGWLQQQPSWTDHPPHNASGSVVAHRGPTMLSEHDCVLQFARFLNAQGIPWEDLHLELSPGQWLVDRGLAGRAPRRIDLAVTGRDALARRAEKGELPAKHGALRLDAVFEFAHASSFWKYKRRAPRPPQAMIRKIREDVEKVGAYLEAKLATLGYVVVVEECDHELDDALHDVRAVCPHVEVVVIPAWKRR